MAVLRGEQTVRQGSPDPASGPSPRQGAVVAARYRLEQPIGHGGMGEVWRARDLELRRAVAIKLLLGDAAGGQEAVRRFMREARAASATECEHIVRIFDVGSTGHGTPFMVMELLEGESLAALLRRRGRLPVEEACHLLLQACLGVAVAHARGIIHRDLKPSNLFVLRGDESSATVKLLDFGIAKSFVSLDDGGQLHSLTRTGSTLGTPGYLSPEQLRSSRDVDARTDVWALGAILHKMLAGQAAFAAAHAGEYYAMIVTEAPTPLREHLPDAPRALEDLIRHCLERDRRRRCPTVLALARALGPFARREDLPIIDRIARTLHGCTELPHDHRDRGAASPEARTGSVPRARADSQTVADPAAPHRAAATAGGTEPSPPPSPDGGKSRRTRRRWRRGPVAAIGAAGALWLAWWARRPPPQLEPGLHAPLIVTAAPLADQATVRVALHLEPADALVRVDGRRRSDNPLLLPRDGRSHRLELSAPGHATLSETLVADHDRELHRTLRPEPAGNDTPARPIAGRHRPAPAAARPAARGPATGRPSSAATATAAPSQRAAGGAPPVASRPPAPRPTGKGPLVEELP